MKQCPIELIERNNALLEELWTLVADCSDQEELAEKIDAVTNANHAYIAPLIRIRDSKAALLAEYEAYFDAVEKANGYPLSYAAWLARVEDKNGVRCYSFTDFADIKTDLLTEKLKGL